MIVDFSNEHLPIEVTGVSFAESFGRWTDAPVVRMTVPMHDLSKNANALRFEISLMPFVPPTVGAQIVDVLINGKKKTTWAFHKHSESLRREFYISSDEFNNSENLTFELLIHYPTKPADLRSNQDYRMLGLALKSLVVSPASIPAQQQENSAQALTHSQFDTEQIAPPPETRHDPKWFFPNNLNTGAREPRKFALFGTCIAEAMVNDIRLLTPNTADHYLLGSSLNDEVPDVSGQGYDAAIIHLTLRYVLHQIIARQYDDLMHTRMSEENQTALLGEARTLLNKLVEKLMAAMPVGTPVFFMSFIEPPSTARGLFWNNRKTSLYYLVRSMNDILAEILERTRDGYYLEVNDIRQYYGDMSTYDGYESYFTHAGNFSSEFSVALSDRMEQALRVLQPRQPIKLIVSDLDNTLWKGVLAEEEEFVGYDLVDGWPLGYAEALLECKRRGILLAISSKNEEKFILENFRKVYGERLSLDDFCSVKVSWNPKSAAIKEILQEVNLLPQNVLFIDDNPLEIAEVKQAIPDIRVLSGEQKLWRMVLHYAPETQVAVVTEESSKRTELIRAKIDRERESEGVDRSTYLHSLKLKTKISVIKRRDDAKFSRAFELLNKTNQFNTTGKRWTEQECEELFAQNGEFIALTASDIHAEHGLVSVAIVQDDRIVQVVMSCRVFGLGLETALLNFIMNRIQTSHPQVRGYFQATGRNTTCEKYFPNAGFEAADGVFHGQIAPEFPTWISITE